MNILFYRPDKFQAYKVNPEAVFTLKGQPFSDWQRDQQTAYDYKVELLKRKLHRKPRHKIIDYWR